MAEPLSSIVFGDGVKACEHVGLVWSIAQDGKAEPFDHWGLAFVRNSILVITSPSGFGGFGGTLYCNPGNVFTTRSALLAFESARLKRRGEAMEIEAARQATEEAKAGVT